LCLFRNHYRQVSCINDTKYCLNFVLLT
jgi:hypothetical protein